MSTTDLPETITRDELAEALRGLKITPEDENTFYPAMAEAIFGKVRRNREPEYEPGEAYVDARGDNYLRSETGGWVDYSTTWHPHGGPKCPLRKLVPEGSDETVIERSAVAAVIAKGILGDESSDVIIHRIGQLLDGES